MTKSRRSILFASLVVVSALVLIYTTRGPGDAVATEPEDLRLGFRDQANGTYLLGQFGDEHADEGEFVAVVAGVDVVWPEDPGATSVGMGSSLYLNSMAPAASPAKRLVP